MILYRQIRKRLHGKCFHNSTIVLEIRQHCIEDFLTFFRRQFQPRKNLRKMPPHFFLLYTEHDSQQQLFMRH